MDADAIAQLQADQAKPLPHPTTSFAGKTVIVTGSNTGLGREAARHFVRCHASKVILAVRSESRGAAAQADIEASTGISGVAEVWPLDLASYGSVKAFAARAQKLERLDVLIENASVGLDAYEEAEGAEMTMTVNVYGTFLLAVLLMPKLRETAKKVGTQTVLDVVTSALGWSYPLEERRGEEILAVMEKRGSDGSSPAVMAQYAATKLLQFLVCIEMSKVFPLKETGVIINYLSPGLVETDLIRNLKSENAQPIMDLRALCARTAEDGARNLFWTAVAGPESHGQYISECEIVTHKMPPWILAEEDGAKASRKLWEELTKKLDLIDPGCVEKATSAK